MVEFSLLQKIVLHNGEEIESSKADDSTVGHITGA